VHKEVQLINNLQIGSATKEKFVLNRRKYKYFHARCWGKLKVPFWEIRHNNI